MSKSVLSRPVLRPAPRQEPSNDDEPDPDDPWSTPIEAPKAKQRIRINRRPRDRSRIYVALVLGGVAAAAFFVGRYPGSIPVIGNMLYQHFSSTPDQTAESDVLVSAEPHVSILNKSADKPAAPVQAEQVAAPSVIAEEPAPAPAPEVKAVETAQPLPEPTVAVETPVAEAPSTPPPPEPVVAKPAPVDETAAAAVPSALNNTAEQDEALPVTASPIPPAMESAAEPPTPAPASTPAPEAEQQTAMATTPPPAPAAPVAEEPAVQPASPSSLAGQVFRDCSNCPELVVVVAPAAPAGGTADPKIFPAGELKQSNPYAMGRTEITFDDWDRCVAEGGCTTQPKDEGWGKGTHPVINVSYMDVTEQYIPWLSKVTGKTYRLPTAEEWEFAAEGAVPGWKSGSALFDAATLCKTGNYAATSGAADEAPCNDAYPKTAPAGSMQPNSLGLFDMRGNVWEWVSDCWTPGFTYKVKDSEKSCEKHKTRGGSWSSHPTVSKAAPAGWEDAKRERNSIGFRVLRVLP